MGKSLVIVESPAKARTIGKFLGDSYVVESSIGHVRDLPKRAGDVPTKYKKEPWARLGVDVDNGFKALYVVDPGKRDHIKKLKALLESTDELLLATDEDREGESIAWHLLQVLNPKVPVKRMVFHEITRNAIAHALETPRQVDQHLVDAQEARRILDRLYGYEVSPVLWKKVMPKLSAGRVQSVATRIIVERERERVRFRPAAYWDVEAEAQAEAGPSEGDARASRFPTTLVTVGQRRVATGRDFDALGKVKREGTAVLDEQGAQAIAKALPKVPLRVDSVESKPYKRSPAAPFMTSTLQQEAGRKLRLSAARAMQVAQRLYESGYITYMRTDSTTLSQAALSAARREIGNRYGADYLPPEARTYRNKVKNAQEAHEAIRPAGDVFRSFEEVAKEVSPDEARLYELIWKRTVASQMVDARGETLAVRLSAQAPGHEVLGLSASGNTLTFPGFQRAYVEGSDDPDAELEGKERRLPALREGQVLPCLGAQAKGHETQPPARYTEASLVRRLEELGVGRPSTYASIISTIQDRGYVWKRGTALVPSFTAFVVVELLERFFGPLVDYAFTARMEDELDAIARGDEHSVPWLERFYFGSGAQPAANSNDLAAHGLRDTVEKQLGAIDAREINTLVLGKSPDDQVIALRVGRYGPYLEMGELRANLPEGLAPDELSAERAMELLQTQQDERIVGTDPLSGLQVVLKNGRFGTYVQLGTEVEDGQKPKRASLISSMDASTLTLEQALYLLSLPRELGLDAEHNNEPVVLHNGRYGPYVTRGKETRSLEREEDLLTLSLEQGLALLAQPKRRGRRAAAEPLRELGTRPGGEQVIRVHKGRFGHYVTDGEINASLRTGDDVESLSLDRALELLEIRKEKLAAEGKLKPKKGAKKPTAKKRSPTKKAGTSKAGASKAGATKTGANKAGTHTAAANAERAKKAASSARP